jgi:hypothetical protein
VGVLFMLFGGFALLNPAPTPIGYLSAVVTLGFGFLIFIAGWIYDEIRIASKKLSPPDSKD